MKKQKAPVKTYKQFVLFPEMWGGDGVRGDKGKSQA